MESIVHRSLTSRASIRGKTFGPMAVIAAGSIAGMLLMAGCSGEAPAPADEPAAMDEKALALMRSVTDQFAAAQQIRVRGVQTVEAALAEARDRPQTEELTALLKRPNRLMATISGPGDDRRMFFDGSDFTLLDETNNFYSSVPMPGDVDTMVLGLEERFGFAPPVAELFLSDAYDYFMDLVISARYVGEEVVEGQRYHRVSFGEEEVDWDIWISVDRELPVRFVASMPGSDGDPIMWAEFHEINLNADLDDSLFEFRPPPEAKKIRMLTVEEIYLP